MRISDWSSDVCSSDLRIGITPVVTGYFLSDILSRFRRMFPQITVTLVEDKRDYIEHLLVNGELDLGILIVSNLVQKSAIRSEAHTSELQSLMRTSYADFCLKKNKFCIFQIGNVHV